MEGWHSLPGAGGAVDSASRPKHRFPKAIYPVTALFVIENPSKTEPSQDNQSKIPVDVFCRISHCLFRLGCVSLYPPSLARELSRLRLKETMFP